MKDELYKVNIHSQFRLLRLRPYLIGLLLFFGQAAIAQPGDEASDGQVELIEIMVTGHLPGPRLWKVSNGNNELWILPYLALLPDGLRWDSKHVEDVLARSQQYIPRLINNYSISIPEELIGNPDQQKLKEVLPPDVFTHYKELKNKYFRFNRSLDKLRPVLASGQVAGRMYRKHDLESGVKVLKKIEKLARRNPDLLITEFNLAVPDALLERAKAAMLQHMETLTLEQEVTCFENALNRVEEDINTRKHLANAWAEGQVSEFDYLLAELNEGENLCATVGGLELQKELDDFGHSNIDQWLAGVDEALATNSTTFAVLNISFLFGDSYLLDGLRDRGYEIRVPE